MRTFIREQAVSHEKAQKAQKKESLALTETFTEWVTTVSTPSFSFCGFCAFSWPSTAVFRFIPLVLLATAIVTGCSTVGSRKAERADAYNALSARHRALVDEGFIDVGMNTNAVYIAWGKPYEIMRVDFPSGERTVWVYTGATSEQVSSWQYRPSSSPYSARRGTSEPTTTTILRRRTNGWVSFENGTVVSFDSYAPARAQ